MMDDCSATGKADSPRTVAEAGFTIVETLVAIFILMVGVLALVSAAASLPSVVDEGRVDQRLAVMAVGELERLRLYACGGAASGERSVGTWTVSWSVVEHSGGVLQMEVIVASETGRWRKADTLTSAIAC